MTIKKTTTGKQNPAKETEHAEYGAVLADITRLYDTTLGMPTVERNRLLVQTYWRIGQRIVQVVQGGRRSAEYGKEILKRLSGDLTEKYGDGFSPRSLLYIRRFAIEYPSQTLEDPLSWSQYRSLLGVRDAKARAKLEARTRKESLPCKELDKLVRRANGRSFVESAETDGPLLVSRKGQLNLYRLEKSREGKHTVCYLDAGFSVKHRVTYDGLSRLSERSIVRVTDNRFERVDGSDESERFCYRGSVVRVVDGDTMLIRVDLGFGVVCDQRLRLRGVDAAELGTAEGEKAKRFVEALMPFEREVLLLTYGCDVYGRYLADVYFSEHTTDLTPDLQNATFLNAHIISAGHAGFLKASRWKD